MATTLRKLKIRRVALVDKGANPEAFVTLFKRDDSQEEEPVVEGEMVSKADLEAAVAKVETEKQEIAKRAEAAEREAETVKAELAKRQEQEEIAKYDADAKATPFLGDEGGKWLRQIAKALGDEAYGAFHGKLSGVSAQVEEGELFKERGTGTDGDVTDPEAVATSVAKRLKSEHPKWSDAKAKAEAYATDEYTQALRARMGGK